MSDPEIPQPSVVIPAEPGWLLIPMGEGWEEGRSIGLDPDCVAEYSPEELFHELGIRAVIGWRVYSYFEDCKGSGHRSEKVELRPLIVGHNNFPEVLTPSQFILIAPPSLVQRGHPAAVDSSGGSFATQDDLVAELKAQMIDVLVGRTTTIEVAVARVKP